MDPSQLINSLLAIINTARTNPANTATQLYNSLSPLYHDEELKCWGRTIETFEGIEALEDLRTQLKKQPSAEPLRLSDSLSRAAQLIAQEKGNNGRSDHDSPQAIFDRISGVAEVRGRVGELISLRANSAEEIATYFLLDDGLATRKRRRMLLDQGYTQVGVGCAWHKQHEMITVILLAENVKDLVVEERVHAKSEADSYFHGQATIRPVESNYRYI